MKNLIILVGIIFSSLQIILAGDLEYPLLIDGGEINIRYYSNKAFADNIVNYKTEHRSLKNISNENIYIYEAIKYSTYDSIISAIGNSNFFSLDINRPILKQGDSLDIFCKFFSKYLDPISLTGNKLMSIWRTYYRRESSLKLDSIDISLLFNAVDKDEVVFDQLSGRVLSNIKNGYKTDSDTSYNFSFFYNLTDKKILIDSINHVISGVNFKKLIILNNDTSIAFPSILNPNMHLTFKVPFQTIQPEESKCLFTVFYHFIDSSIAISKTDTIFTQFKLNDYLTFDMSTFRNFSIKLGDTVKLTSKQGYIVYNADDRIWKLVNASALTKLNNIVNLELFNTLPVLINKNQTTKLVKVSVIGNQIGFDTIKVTLDLEDSLGNKMQRSNVYYINVLKPTDIIPDLNKEEFLVQISPNPVSDFIEISVGARRAVSEQSDVRIYDVLGQTVSFVRAGLEPAPTVRIDVSGLAPGMYFVRIGDKVTKFVKI